jgi:hypothetical protein
MDDDSSQPFLYSWWTKADDIPRNVTHVKVVDPAVKVIREKAFAGCRQLMIVELCEGLEQIDRRAFYGCTSLTSISVPSTVKWIDKYAFYRCTKLIKMDLCEGLGWIDRGAFQDCTSLKRIIIPSTVKVIGRWAFKGCIKLMNVKLCEGLERIDSEAFENCTSLEWIIIPSTVSFINKSAFKGCSGLVSVEFCEEIEQFVNDVFLPWWNLGKSPTSLMMYSLLAGYKSARLKIPALLCPIKVQAWKSNIQKMLQRILVKREWDEKACNYVESQLYKYEHLQNGLTILELALWKAKIMEQSNTNIINAENDVKWMCRVNSWSMFAIIFPNVIPFLSVDE